MRVSNDVFLALASFQKREGASLLIDADGLRRAATSSLRGADLDAVMASIDARPGAPVRAIDGGSMSEADRTLTFALVTWFSQLGSASTGGMPMTQAIFLSARVLVTLGDELQVHPDIRERATALTYKLACLPLAERPDVYDLQAVAARLEKQLFAPV